MSDNNNSLNHLFSKTILSCEMPMISMHRRLLRATAHVYIVYEHHAIFCKGFRRQTGTKPYGDRAEIVGKSCSHCAVSARKSYGGHAEMVRWLCNCREVLGIRVPKVHKFTFLLVLSVEMAPQVKQEAGRERGPRRTCGFSHLKNVDQSRQGKLVPRYHA